jgi:prevent-host-death family protein
MKWKLQEAKTHFSSVVRKAADEGPQIITVHGKPTTIVLSTEEYNRLIKSNTRLTDFFKDSPLHDTDLDLRRNP